MARSGGGFLRTHGKLWYDAPAYRWAWLILPQAVALTLMGVFVMGGGLATLSPQQATPVENGASTTQWGKPANPDESFAALNPLRDKAGTGDAAALATLEKMAADGNAEASFKLGTLYDPTLTNLAHPKTKDAQRALSYYEPGRKANMFAALYRTMLNQTAPESPVYDPLAACKTARAIQPNAGFAADKLPKDDAWLVLTVADCFSNAFRPPNVAFQEPSKADAEVAMALYQHPIVSGYLDAKREVGKLYLRATSPVADMARGCTSARSWADEAINTNKTFVADDKWLLTAAAGCMLNIFRAPGVQYSVPAHGDQTKALAVLQLPVLNGDNFAQRTTALAYVNEQLAIKDASKACEFARAWARNPVPETDLPVDSVFFVYVGDCLMANIPGAKRHEPDQQDVDLARNLFIRTAQAGDMKGWHRIGYYSERGRGPWPKNQDEARSAYEKCAAETVDCQSRLGIFHEFGWGGFDKDPAAALKVYKTCSKQGSAYCDGRIALFYAQGSGGLQRDLAASTKFARKAAEAGDGLAAEILAFNLYSGAGAGKPDPKGSAKWMVVAIQRNGEDSLRQLQEVNAKVMTDPAFWQAFHNELQANAVYYGAISGAPTAATFEAARKLIR